MKCNVTRLEIERRYVEDGEYGNGKRPWRDECLSFVIKTTEMEHAVSPYLHGKEAIDEFLAQLHGDHESWRQKMAFTDGGYTFEGFKDGITLFYESGGEIKKYYITFPGGLLHDEIAYMTTNKYRRQMNREFSEEELRKLRRRFFPVARLKFGSDETRQQFMDCLHARPDLFTEENTVQLRNAVRNLMRIARNYSDGDPVIVTLNAERPYSFNWNIYKKGKYRIMNGGIIAHATRDSSDKSVSWTDQPIIGYSYSVHT